MKEIESREDLELLLAEFYKIAPFDAEIGHHFNGVDLENHLPVIVDFWEKILFSEFQKMVTGELNTETDENSLGKLKIFAGVLEFPARVKCASLSWHTLHAALSGEDEVSTE